MLHLGHVDPVVLGVRAEELDEHDLRRIVDRHDQPVGVPLDVEHDALVADDARGPVPAPNMVRPTPLRTLDLLEPDLERVLSVAILGPGMLQGPFWEQGITATGRSRRDRGS
jgi:hypothetical protein